MHKSHVLLVVLFLGFVLGFGFACGDEEADLCFSPAGIPSYVGRTGTTSPTFVNFAGCSATPAPTPPIDDPDVGLCDDACTELAACGNGDFDACVENCEANPACADAFRCFRDVPCADQIDECLDELSVCQ